MLSLLTRPRGALDGGKMVDDRVKDPGSGDYFVPAVTVDEGIARIFGLTGGRDPGRGEKRALIALRDALDLDVDVVRTNSVLGRSLAEAMAVEWNPDRHTVRNKVTLDGLNVLLKGATNLYRNGRLKVNASAKFSTLTGPHWDDFRPAQSKIEAVTRIAALTNAPPETLGPGAKEHKSVLENLADRALSDVSLDRSSKTRLARSLAEHFDVAWTDTCYSTGETISLEGLNTVLAGAERYLGRLGKPDLVGVPNPSGEADLLVSVIRDGWTGEPWDGRATVQWLRSNNLRGANDNEWQGFYFEGRSRELAASALGPPTNSPRVRFGSTIFDYARDFIWDFKAHTEASRLPVSGKEIRGRAELQLNDANAVRECVDQQGLGFIVLSGAATMDENGTFVAWHREFKAESGRRTAPSNSERSRTRKSAFSPLRVDAFWIGTSFALDEAVTAGVMRVAEQGRQAPKEPGTAGVPRAPKFHLDVVRARGSLMVASRSWIAPDARGNI